MSISSAKFSARQSVLVRLSPHAYYNTARGWPSFVRVFGKHIIYLGKNTQLQEHTSRGWFEGKVVRRIKGRNGVNRYEVRLTDSREVRVFNETTMVALRNRGRRKIGATVLTKVVGANGHKRTAWVPGKITGFGSGNDRSGRGYKIALNGGGFTTHVGSFVVNYTGPTN
ncbi:MAG: hypothetical protein K2X77_32820 [Candidatus Obscuribacterales bacterium]|jgi:hypothetical protein|nr:hypothetical protein [Candidatus Obscuribacterales bacterium]